MNGCIIGRFLPAIAVLGLAGVTLAAGTDRPETYGKGLPRDLDTLGIADADYPDWRLRPDQAAYAGVSGQRMKDWTRTLLFFIFPDHHHGEAGLKLFEKNHDWDNVALALTIEHPAQTQLYWYNDDLMTSNAIGAFRWNALGSERFVKTVTDTLRKNGVSIYTEMNPKPKLTRQAPGFHIIDHVIYHTTLDIPELVLSEGLERSTRAFLEIIDQANKMSLEELRH